MQTSPTVDQFPRTRSSDTSLSMSGLVWRKFRRHPGAVAGSVVFLALVLAVLLAPLSPFDPDASSMEERNRPPSLHHPMGTDALGRDLLTRALYGGRVSLTVG